MQQRGAASGRHQQRAEADQAAAGALEGDDRAAGIAAAEIGDAALARRELLGDGADVLVGNVAHAALLRLELLAVDFLGDHLGPADLQLVALAAHRLDEHRQLQLAAAGDLDDVGRAGLEQLDRHVAEQLSVQPVDQVAAGEVLAVLAGERRGVDAERHPQHRLVDGQPRQRDRVVGAGDGVADLDLGEAGDDEQVAGATARATSLRLTPSNAISWARRRFTGG